MKMFEAISEVEIAGVEHIEVLVYTATFAEDGEIKKGAQKRIRDIAEEQGVFLASINPLYRAFGSGEAFGFTVPACNLRTLTYDTARVFFQLSKELDTRAFVFEIARSEMRYTEQDPEEYVTSVLAGALAEEYRGPVFIQGDHFQLNRESFAKNSEQEVAELKASINQAVHAGFYNIDIDASTLVNLDLERIEDQQKNNFEITAELTRYIRSVEPKGITISIGGELGHIGGKNSTPEEFSIFMTHYLKAIGEIQGMSKVSVQTGTHHGGVVLADGRVASVDIDFSVLKSITKIAREEYAMGGSVQHGASTLPEELFHNFFDHDAIEVHFATGLQNTIYEQLPKDIVSEMDTWIEENLSEERSSDMTRAQFIYKSRKKAFGPFKEVLWDMTEEEKRPILEGLKKQIASIMKALHTSGSREVVDRFVK